MYFSSRTQKIAPAGRFDRPLAGQILIPPYLHYALRCHGLAALFYQLRTCG